MTVRRKSLARTCAIGLASMLSLTLAAPAMAARAGGDSPDNPGGKKKPEEAKPCPTDKWTVPLEVNGLACILLLPKKEDAKGGGGPGGGGGLLG